MKKSIKLFQKNIAISLIPAVVAILLLPQGVFASEGTACRMLSPALQIQDIVFGEKFAAQEMFCRFEKLSERETLRQDLEIFFAVSNRIKGKIVPRNYKFSRHDEREFTKWFFSEKSLELRIPPLLLKKLFINLQAMCRHGNAEVRRQAEKWVPRFAERWSVKEIQLRNLVYWLETNITKIDDVQEHVLVDFVREYLNQYRNNERLNDNFRYLVHENMTDGEKLSNAVTNMRLMSALSSPKYYQGEEVLKARIGNTKYFIGMRFGQYATSSTFVNEILIGEENYSCNPLSGVFFRLGFDTEGSASVRVVQMGGVQYKKEVLSEFMRETGITPDKALLLALLEIGKRNGFENIAGVRKDYLANAKEITLPYIAMFKSFGITRKHPLGAIRPILTDDGLLVRWEKKAEQSLEINKGYQLIKEAVNNLSLTKSLLTRAEVRAIYEQEVTPLRVGLSNAALESSI